MVDASSKMNSEWIHKAIVFKCLLSLEMFTLLHRTLSDNTAETYFDFQIEQNLRVDVVDSILAM